MIGENFGGILALTTIFLGWVIFAEPDNIIWRWWRRLRGKSTENPPNYIFRFLYLYPDAKAASKRRNARRRRKNNVVR